MLIFQTLSSTGSYFKTSINQIPLQYKSITEKYNMKIVIILALIALTHGNGLKKDSKSIVK